MIKTNEKRRLEFIEENVYDELDKEVRDELLSFRRLYNMIVKKEGLVDNLQKKIRLEKDKLMAYIMWVTKTYPILVWLKK
jgi:hypothetical protein